MIWLWDIERGSYRKALHGHTAVVHDLAFMPDGRSLLSGSEDGTLRVWDVERGQCARVIQDTMEIHLIDESIWMWSADSVRVLSRATRSLSTTWPGTLMAPG